ncbi:MAG: hypothetical protein Q8M23_02290 [Bacteroidales bacterium]|nr:hypothetical protein [Bacteroidales bacterium]
MPFVLPSICVALPVLNEFENLPVFLENIRAQDYRGPISLFACVNQPEEWWQMPDKQHICENNRQSIEFLNQQNGFSIHIIDRSSKNKGWQGRQHGVGHARREVMQAIENIAHNEDIIISLDADTGFRSGYFSSVVSNLRQHPQYTALSVPYYHKLTGNPLADRAILRYEIYMRAYAINLMRIDSPYAFTALGSAIALTVKNYKSIGGITPKMSGEDFYFLQKLRKKGEILCWNSEKVYPAARFSDRVYFGTGPAMILGASGDWSSYPVYAYQWFDEIRETYKLFAPLYAKDICTPLDEFLSETYVGEKIWQNLRQHAASQGRFVRACHEKIDGLRVLQFLKWRQKQYPVRDEGNLSDFITTFYPDAEAIQLLDINKFSFSLSPIKALDSLRNFLAEKEADQQKSLFNALG